jgi:hypothetical protein
VALAETDLAIDQGSDYVHEWQWLTEDDDGVRTPRDLTGWTGRMMVRRSPSAALVLATLGTDTGTIILDADGVIRVEVPAATSSAWSWHYGVFDLEVVDPDGGVTRFVSGSVQLSAEVTR